MLLLVLIFAVCLLVPVAAGVRMYRSPKRAVAQERRGDALVDRIGTGRSAALVLVLGLGAAIAIALAFGFVAKSLQSAVDNPVFSWVHAHATGGSFTTLNEKLTLTGNNSTTQLVVLFATIVLAAAYGRRWWLPAVGIIGAYYLEHYVQKFVGKVVDRKPGPIGQGTYFSGGVARILAVYGVVLLLAMLLLPNLRRGWRIGLWTGLATTAAMEAFTRVYLSKHWLTDTIGGLIGGSALLAVVATTLVLLARAAGVTARSERSRSGSSLGGSSLGGSSPGGSSLGRSIERDQVDMAAQ